MLQTRICCRLVVALAAASYNDPGVAQISLPQDAVQYCQVKNFPSWFQSGTVAVNGAVDPPNAFSFPNIGKCPFYEWAEHIFLWLTSPASRQDGVGFYVFDTPIFYQVSPADDDKRRKLTVNNPDLPKEVSVDISQSGSGGDAVGFDRNGNIYTLTRDQTQVSQPALMAQGNRLVYYSIEVNDVFAYFLTGVKKGRIHRADGGVPINFPVTSEELQAVESFAKRDFSDKNTLVVEVKFAWIEAAGLPNRKSYVTTWANIATYDASNYRHWVPNTWRKAQLALVGMHIAFAVPPHKELVWATFEHVNNAPNDTYKYYRYHDSEPVLQPADIGGSWLFSSGGAEMPSERNVQRMYSSGDHVLALRNQTIGPTNVLRHYPWGIENEDADGNTYVISINNSIRSQLYNGDVRKNYVMIGAVWSGGSSYFPEGGNRLVNSTMETFFERSNCLACHRGFGSNMLGGVSHIYDQTSPLRFP